MTSGFGMRFHPILGYNRPHTGVDWGAPMGTPILAAGSGVILTVERNSAYGNHIEIQHANGYVTTYSHMSGFARGIANGLHVRQGQVIAISARPDWPPDRTSITRSSLMATSWIRCGSSSPEPAKWMARCSRILKREHERIDALMASAPNSVQDPNKHAAN